MKPLYHPPLSEIRVEGILHALSEPVRAGIYAEMAQADCPQTCSSFRLLNERPIPKSTLSTHFKILREAGLVRSERRGVEMRNTTRCRELQEKFGNLISTILSAYQTQSESVKS